MKGHPAQPDHHLHHTFNSNPPLCFRFLCFLCFLCRFFSFSLRFLRARCGGTLLQSSLEAGMPAERFVGAGVRQDRARKGAAQQGLLLLLQGQEAVHKRHSACAPCSLPTHLHLPSTTRPRTPLTSPCASSCRAAPSCPCASCHPPAHTPCRGECSRRPERGGGAGAWSARRQTPGMASTGKGAAGNHASWWAQAALPTAGVRARTPAHLVCSKPHRRRFQPLLPLAAGVRLGHLARHRLQRRQRGNGAVQN